MKLAFSKMSGAGNDFVVLDAKDLPKNSRTTRGLSRLAPRLCARRSGIGADGILILERFGSARPRLKYFNADGSEAFCGNGARCAAWWIHQKGWANGKELQFASDAGLLEARIISAGPPPRVAIHMPNPRSVRLSLGVTALGKRLAVHSINTGVPHAVLEVAGLAKLESFPVVELGRALRRHRAFSPAGTNVNFVVFGPKAVTVRTYERGVEDETLACGTGATASALTACLLDAARSPVSVRVRGGATLTVSFKRKDFSFSDVWLEGPAELTFSGEVDL